MTSRENIPRHVAIIMDGNGRWARARGLDRVEGHVRGVESVRGTIAAAVRHGIGWLTLYVFSQENWGRPTAEVDALMELICSAVANETSELVRQGVRVKIIGDRDRLPDRVRTDVEKIERETAAGQTITLQLALSYGSRSEMVEAVRRIVRSGMRPEAIDEQTVGEALYTAGSPDPDLVIRTGGDQRLSNFMLWQAAYAELYFVPEYWPDFDEASFDRAVAAYSRRERRYGLV
jgi:undecaprenyl diphosphate synthase